MKAFLCCSLLVTNLAQAQISVGDFGQWTVQTGLTGVMNAGVRAASGNMNGSPPDEDALAAVRHTRDPEITRSIEALLVSIVRQRDPALADELRDLLDQTDVLAAFDQDLEPFGLKSDNIIDAMTAFFLTDWFIANQRDIPPVSRVQKIRDNLREILVEEFAEIKNDRRQLVSEILIYQTEFSLTARLTLLDDPEALAELSELAYQRSLSLGIDMRALDLTDEGLFLINPLPAAYELWFDQFPEATQIERALQADPDGDGIVNLREYFHQLSPVSAADGIGILSFVPELQNNRFTVRYRRGKNLPGISGIPEWSSGLDNWSGSGENQIGRSVTFSESVIDDSAADFEIIETTGTFSSGNPEQAFFRINVGFGEE